MTFRILAALLLLGVATSASAVPSFARQTGMPCSACHTSYPELTQFGRSFKLNGYTLATGKQIQSGTASNSSDLRIAEIPPLSAMVQLSVTHMQKSDPAAQNNAVAFPQEASLFFAGAIAEHAGAFVQVTYAQDAGQFEWDNTDVRYANIAGDTVWGITLNNNPTVQDLWNTTSAWGFPFAGSSAALTPSTAALIDGGLAGDVGGGGAYALFFNHLYAEVTGYRSTHQGTAAPQGVTSTAGQSNNTINGLAPYWRLAWQQSIGQNYLMLGAYGMRTSLYPAGIGAGSGGTAHTDVYTDYALDSQFEMPLGADQLTLRGTWIHETRKLDGTIEAAVLGLTDADGNPISGADNTSDTLNTWRVNGTWHTGKFAPALAYFRTSGGTDATLYGTSTGKPDSAGEILQLAYLPWQNVQATAQYTIYNKFDGASSSYDAPSGGRNASDNNTLYLLLWLMW